MFEMQIIWVLKETHLVDHIHINLVFFSMKLDHGFHNNRNTKVLKYDGYYDSIRQ
ncbi:hypothetical protein Lalb_Chr01g0020911 [Lupinus albus]|uniref:Uncharacterized protein n=1 Tax=Lupinus albus TaxID=3870 RepID=A0A6A4R871_LUPAL|nr:hypothetical protein Lalb_Chr01g0020911 [Lupinus albus]